MNVICDIIFAVAEQQPNAIALSDGNKSITYRQLLQSALQVAWHINTTVKRPQAVIAICSEPSITAIVHLLGILLAGGCYLPLSYTASAEGLLSVCQQAQVALIFTDACKKQQLEKLPILSHEFLQEDIQQYSYCKPAITKLTPAYIIFTSGSTGAPKAVVITHGNLSSMLACAKQMIQPQFYKHLLLFPLEFDGSLASIFWTLQAAGTLYIISNEEKLDVKYVGDFISKHAITHLLCLPAFYRYLLEYAQEQHLSGLVSVMLAGDTLGADIITMHFNRLNQCSLYNAYGTTETTIWNALYQCSKSDGEYGAPIGKPIANSIFYLLDETGNLVLNQGEGELCIAGECVASGYLHNKDNAAFVQLANIPQKILYRTGDIAELNEGIYRLKGRLQSFVKISGYRVNLDYIKEVFYNSGYVQAVEILPEEIHGVINLTAFIVLKYAKQDTLKQQKYKADLKNYLALHLASYMIPAKIHAVEAFPTLPSGKIDQQGLQKQSSAHIFAKPQTPTQQKLYAIVSAILGETELSVYDNLLQLGASSLSAISLIAIINKEFSLNLKVADILNYPSIYMLAERIDTRKTLQAGSSTLVLLKKTTSDSALVCIPPAAALATFYKKFSGYLNYNIDVFSFMPQGLEVGQRPLTSIDTIADTYLAEISPQSAKKYILFGFSFGGYVALQMAHNASQNCELLILCDVPYNFNRAISIDVHSEHFKRFLAQGLKETEVAANTALTPKITDIYKGQEQALKNYTIPPRLTVPIVLITCKQRSADPLFIKDYAWDLYGGWNPHQYPIKQVITIDAKHEELFSEQHIQQVSLAVTELLQHFESIQI